MNSRTKLRTDLELGPKYVDPFGIVAYIELAGREHGTITAKQLKESSMASASVD